MRRGRVPELLALARDLARRRVLPLALALPLLLAGLPAGCGTPPLRYHYPIAHEDAEGALTRLETTTELAEGAGAATPAHMAARATARAALETLEAERIDDEAPLVAALDVHVRELDEAADLARAAIPPERSAPSRDRLYDLERQSRRAARALAVLRRHLGGIPGEGTRP